MGREAAVLKAANAQNFALDILRTLTEAEQNQLLMLLEKIVSR